MKAGDIYWVNLDLSTGDEIRKKRPVVVLNEGHEKHLRLAIVVPVTGWTSNWARNPFFVSLHPDEMNGLRKNPRLTAFSSGRSVINVLWNESAPFWKMN